MPLCTWTPVTQPLWTPSTPTVFLLTPNSVHLSADPNKRTVFDLCIYYISKYLYYFVQSAVFAHVPAGLGFSQPVGHIDFYPNGGTLMPGCSANKGKPTDLDAIWEGERTGTGKHKSHCCFRVEMFQPPRLDHL